MGLGTEILFIEGHSKDNTWEEIQRVKAEYPNRDIKILKQRSKGKGGAVREAFAAATGDLLFILDADLTMPPEQLPKFYEVARSGTADFVNGVRLVYPMEQEAMQFANMVANHFFGRAFSWLLGQSIKDTLCACTDADNTARRTATRITMDLRKLVSIATRGRPSAHILLQRAVRRNLFRYAGCNRSRCDRCH